MTLYYSLRIDHDPTPEAVAAINAALGVQSNMPGSWGYEIVETGKMPYVDALNTFLDLLAPAYEDLERIGIERSDISVWILVSCGPHEQCGSEIPANTLRRLGEYGHSLCLSFF